MQGNKYTVFPTSLGSKPTGKVFHNFIVMLNRSAELINKAKISLC